MALTASASVSLLALPLPVLAAGMSVTLYKNPDCGCCDRYAQYLRSNGFEVKTINTDDLSKIKREHAVPKNLEGCHTALIDGYVFEGLIPVADIEQVLKTHAPIKGLSVPGMPVGAPGMAGNKAGPINVYYLDASATPKVFSHF
ncbi:MAG: DUF411 domain-containing protein [Candidimonas sp.]|nr:MAG: DUF411 domain-containing protein [Candidimonas sp.]